MTLNENEYNGLTKIARKTKCDCWFDIRQDKNGDDYIFDLENRKRLSLRTAIAQLFEAVIEPPTEYGLTDGEIKAIKGLLKEIDYAEIVEQSEATSVTTSSGDDFEPIAHFVLGGDR